MQSYFVAIDIGTSGLRCQSVDGQSGERISTVVTSRHPLPGANVIDHLHFALEMGRDRAHSLLIEAVNRIMASLQVPMEKIIRLAVCGNPIQLSLFQGIEIRDLAYAGKRKVEALEIEIPDRNAVVLTAKDIPGLMLADSCEVVIPPAVRHEIGADALAMMIQTGMLDKDETAMVTDYGTNAEMALFHDGRVITGSTAAGPALEGQQITCGMLAVPGAISDLKKEGGYHRVIVLDGEMLAGSGPLVDLSRGRTMAPGDLAPAGITGTGTVAIMDEAMKLKLISIPDILTIDGELHFDDIFFNEADLLEAGKAVGSVRAGHLTLCREAGIRLEEVQTAYMSGASGTYVDAVKALNIGMIPPRVETVYQVGNTSLAMAVDLVRDLKNLDLMSDLAKRLRKTHCMFASSKTFEQIYILELAYWTEGMPMAQYRDFLKRYGLPDLIPVKGRPEVIKTVERDIADLGRKGLTLITDIGKTADVRIKGCTGCGSCIEECPENALFMPDESDADRICLSQSLCNGVSCRRCERICPEQVFKLPDFFQ
ncbi:MAG: methylamine methyltransferase corrinoid protein reductive activase [Desulfobacterales bacterium]|nr:methylamine methyltransferase corrinoid protein reductive activase [Desulfobacterales bacterium]